jgi:hypothetical protein
VDRQPGDMASERFEVPALSPNHVALQADRRSCIVELELDVQLSVGQLFVGQDSHSGAFAPESDDVDDFATGNRAAYVALGR